MKNKKINQKIEIAWTQRCYKYLKNKFRRIQTQNIIIFWVWN